ncbi:DUF4188 domain-containing protein [Kribbia dieselivorans]|uniref:DUF4188 domain-containing protein n=1 Tax=Kribbia dieselivorans TaxID=331526 RepID=UPI000839750A|nr:DUF4188 domain-containing protein [Kribbia dieselivorans]
MSVNPGRHTSELGEDVTVFLIGMRINHPHRVDLWAPVVAAMPLMQAYLRTHPQAGLLGYHQWFGRTTIMVSYWRSPEDLQAFASDPDLPHLAPWRRYARLRNSEAVGVWHETYVVPATSREVVYVNMPDFGLGRATRVVPIGDGTRTARQRLAAAS